MDFLSFLTQGSTEAPKKKKKKAKPVLTNAEAKALDRAADFSQDFSKVAPEFRDDFFKFIGLMRLSDTLDKARAKMAKPPADSQPKPEEEEEEEEGEEEEEQPEDLAAGPSRSLPDQGKEFSMMRVYNQLRKYDPKFEGCLAAMSIPIGTLKLVCQNQPPLPPRFADGAEITTRETRLQEAATVQSAAIHFALQGLKKVTVNTTEATSDLVAAIALSMHSLSKLVAFLVADALDVSRDEANTLALLQSLPAETHALMIQRSRFPGGGGGATLPASRPAMDARESSGDAKPREQRPLSAPPPVLSPLQPFPIAPPRASLGALLTPPQPQGFPAQLRFQSQPKKPKPKKATAAPPAYLVRKRT
jgi:hypothetical protein